ncbi:MAG TPA: nitrous oxide reductase accessory protein NosL [Candidatus Binatia bacterium]|nr:nitrous oxide reductase accessory protein NosL [Candidatus Binatia bacterium]
MRRLLLGVGLAVAALVAGVVFLWPTSRTDPEPIRYGRDACAYCRMLISQPGFAGEMRDHAGTLTKYDDVGCLLAAIRRAHDEIPAAWVEDHASGELVPLLAASFVRAPAAATPMGHGVVAFRDSAAGQAFARASGGEPVTLEALLREPQQQAGDRP